MIFYLFFSNDIILILINKKLIKTDRIKKLKKSVIEKISAGEVIKRPISVIKELVENSIDAKSTKIIIIIKGGGGLKQILIEDNGKGINKKDLLIICERFTTSKLSKYSDLENINTQGFRGEALSSISYVSNLTIISRTKETELAYSLKYSEGKPLLNEPLPIAGNIGTIIKVEDLFFNNPIKKSNSLKNRNKEIKKIFFLISALSIHHSKINFLLKNENKILLKTNLKLSIKKQIKLRHPMALFKLKQVNKEELDFLLNYLIIFGRTNINKSGLFYLFINNRFLKSFLLKKKLFKILLKFNQLPPFIYLNLSIKSNVCDINIHPSKEYIQWIGEDIFCEWLIKKIKNIFSSGSDSKVKILKLSEQQQLRNIPFPNISLKQKKLDLFNSKINSSEIDNENLNIFNSEIKRGEIVKFENLNIENSEIERGGEIENSEIKRRGEIENSELKYSNFNNLNLNKELNSFKQQDIEDFNEFTKKEKELINKNNSIEKINNFSLSSFKEVLNKENEKEEEEEEVDDSEKEEEFLNIENSEKEEESSNQFEFPHSKISKSKPLNKSKPSLLKLKSSNKSIKEYINSPLKRKRSINLKEKKINPIIKKLKKKIKLESGAKNLLKKSKYLTSYKGISIFFKKPNILQFISDKEIIFKLTQEYLLFKSEILTKIIFKPKIFIKNLLLIGLNSKFGGWGPGDGSKEEISEYLLNQIINQKLILKNFGIILNKKGYLKSINQLIFGFKIPFNQLCLFFLRISSCLIEIENSLDCYELILNNISRFYSFNISQMNLIIKEIPKMITNIHIIYELKI